MKSKIVKDGFLLLFAKLVNIGSSAIIAIFVARYYGVTIYGQYTTAIAFATFILTFTDLGLDTFMLKECSRNKRLLNKYYSNIMVIKSIILMVSSILIIISATLIGYNGAVIKLILLLIPNLVITYYISTFFVIMQINNKLYINAKIQIIQNLLILIVAFIISILKLNIFIYSILQSFISILLFIIYLKVISVKFKPTIKYSRTLILGSLFFGLSSLLYIIYYKIDTVMLSVIKGSYEVGIYEAAYKVVNILISLIVIIDNLVMPKFFKLYKQNKIRMIKIYDQMLKCGFILGIPLSVILMFGSKYIINILYGAQYKDAISVLQILMWTVVIRLLSAIVGFVITASDNMKKKVKFQFYFAILNILLNSIFIPKYGVIGASIATIITEFMVFFTYYIFVRKEFKVKIKIKILFKCIISNIILVIILRNFENANLISIVLLCIIGYFTSVIIFFYGDLKEILFDKENLISINK